MKYIMIAVVTSLLTGIPDIKPTQPDTKAKRVMTHTDSVYINNVLHDSLPGFYYTALNVKAPDYVGRVVAEPFDLGYFFAQTRKDDHPKYKIILRNLLLRDDTLVTSVPLFKLNPDGTYNWAISRVTTNADVERLTAEGKETFLDYFFIRKDKGGEFNTKRFEDLSQKELFQLKCAVINQLFEWRIYVSDEYTDGVLRFSTDETLIERELERKRRDFASRERIKRSRYIREILHDSLPGEFYIAFDVQVPDYAGRAVMKVEDLEAFYRKNQDMQRPDFRQLMRSMIIDNKPLSLTVPVADLRNSGWEVGTVTSHAEVQKYAEQGREVFLNHFFKVQDKTGEFDQNVLQGLDDKEKVALQNAVINQLFAWDVYVSGEVYPGTLRFSTDEDLIDRLLEQQRKQPRGKGKKSMSN